MLHYPYQSFQYIIDLLREASIDPKVRSIKMTIYRAAKNSSVINALINAVGGATWVSFHHGGGVGMGYSQHAGQVIVADGTPEAARRLERVLTTDPGMGVARHADAGYEIAIDAAKRHGLKMPMLGKSS